jgi:2-keto-3-deoxy-L-rhamnonate aldolase RhmA
MANKIKEMWNRDETVVAGWLSIPSGYSAEVMAKSGFDALTVDMQHGIQDYQSMVSCFQAITGTGPVPMARVHRQGSGRRCNGRHLPDGEHRRGGRAACLLSALSPTGRP